MRVPFSAATWLVAVAVAALLAACGDKPAPKPSAATSAHGVAVGCADSFAPTAAMRTAIVKQHYVDVGPLTLVNLRQLAARQPIQASSLQVLVIATPGASVDVTIDARDRARAGFLPAPATNVSPLPSDAQPRFHIAGCSTGRASERSLGYAMTWAVASPGCVHFTVAEVGGERRRAAIPFGGAKRC